MITPLDSRWKEFFQKLEFLLGGPSDNKCNGRESSNPFHFSRIVLAEMGAEVGKNIAIFQRHGGNCDCTILFNVEESFELAKKHGLDPLAETYSDDLNTVFENLIKEREKEAESMINKWRKSKERAIALLKKHNIDPDE